MHRDGGSLRDVPDPRPVPELSQGGAEQVDLAVLVRYESEQGPDEGGLAGAVAAEERHDLVLLHEQ